VQFHFFDNFIIFKLCSTTEQMPVLVQVDRAFFELYSQLCPILTNFMKAGANPTTSKFTASPPAG
jgi:hypothetical protein